MADIADLVAQMHDTLSDIHRTITSCSLRQHEARLDGIEQRRAAAVAALESDFAAASAAAAQHRAAQRAALAEQRRLEDAALAAQADAEDAARQDALATQTADVDARTDAEMAAVEAEAGRVLAQTKTALATLEQRRAQLNRMIDEQLRRPLPAVPSRRRASRLVLDAQFTFEPHSLCESPTAKEPLPSQNADIETEASVPNLHKPVLHASSDSISSTTSTTPTLVEPLDHATYDSISIDACGNVIVQHHYRSRPPLARAVVPGNGSRPATPASSACLSADGSFEAHGAMHPWSEHAYAAPGPGSVHSETTVAASSVSVPDSPYCGGSSWSDTPPESECGDPGKVLFQRMQGLFDLPGGVDAAGYSL